MSTSKPLPVVLAHQMPGRARLHLQLEQGHEDAAEKVLHAVAAHPAVRDARPSARARSVLVLHQGEIAPILGDVEARGLITVQPPGQTAPANLALRSVEVAFDSIDGR